MKFIDLEERFFKNKNEFEEADRDRWVGRGESYFFKNQGRTAQEQQDLVSANLEKLDSTDAAAFDKISAEVDKTKKEIQRVSTQCKPGGKELEKFKIQAVSHVLKTIEGLKQKEAAGIYTKIVELEKKQTSDIKQLLSLEKAKLITSSMSEADITGEIIRIRNGGSYTEEYGLALRAKCDGKARESLDTAVGEVPAYLSGENFRILKRFRELLEMGIGEYSIKITSGGKELVENLTPALWLNDKVKQPEIAGIEI